MKHDESHLSDQELLQDLDAELSVGEAARVQTHLLSCSKCLERRQELEQAAADFTGFERHSIEAQLPPAAGPRTRLRAELSQLATDAPAGHPIPQQAAFALAAAACVVLAFGIVLVRSGMDRSKKDVVIYVPNSSLTPGATLLVSRHAVCSQANTNNKPVPPPVQRQVFAEYGIARADPHAYEVDYLVTPALGGADDIHNLWPHSTSEAVWNAPVKDALEDRLRQMVCDGSLDLNEAQREIAANWIAAYKKYFHTDKPLAER